MTRPLDVAGRDVTVAELTAEGRNTREISERLGMSRRSVTRARARQGLTPGVCPERWTPERLELFDQHLTDGWSYREIARTYGVNAQSVSARFPGRGWDRSLAWMGRLVKLTENLPDAVMQSDCAVEYHRRHDGRRTPRRSRAARPPLAERSAG